MPVYDLNIDSLRSGSDLAVTGAASVVEALSDASDASYAKAAYFQGKASYTLANPSSPAGRLCSIGIAVRNKRVNDSLASATILSIGGSSSNSGVRLVYPIGTSIVDSEILAHQGQDPDSPYFPGAAPIADNLGLAFSDVAAPAARATIYKALARLYYLPSVSCGAPSAPAGTVTTTQTPVCTVPLSLLVESWQLPSGLSPFLTGGDIELAIYHSADAPGAAPPATPGPVWTRTRRFLEDTVGTRTPDVSLTPDVCLPNGTYVVFARASRDLMSGAQLNWSAWAKSAVWTQDLALPTAPTLTPTADDANQRMALSVNCPTAGGYDSATGILELQRLVGAGVWCDVRGLTNIAIDIGIKTNYFTNPGFELDSDEVIGTDVIAVDTLADTYSDTAARLCEYRDTLYAGAACFNTGNGYGGLVYAFNVSTGLFQVAFNTNEQSVRSMCVYNDILYVGTGIGAQVFAWDGATMTQVFAGTGGSSLICAAVYDGKLYFGSTSGELHCYNGATWSTLTTVSQPVESLAVLGGLLYAVCGNEDVGTSWKAYASDGLTAWLVHQTPSTDKHQALSVCPWRGCLYVGEYDPTGNASVTKYDPAAQTWTVIPMPAPYTNGALYSLVVYHDRLYIGSHGLGKLFRYDGSTVTLVGSLAGAQSLRDLVVYNDWLFIACRPTGTPQTGGVVFKLRDDYNRADCINFGVNGEVYTRPDGRLGGFCQRIQHESAGDNRGYLKTDLSDPIPASPGDEITFSAYYKAALTGTYAAAIAILWLGAAEAFCGVDTGDDLADCAGWTRYHIHATAPANTTHMELQFVRTTDAATGDTMDVWVDDALVMKSPALGDYFDGDHGGAWAGTPNASVSVILATGHDYEADREVTNTYRSRLSLVRISDGIRFYSMWVEDEATGPAVTGWNLKTVEDPDGNMIGAPVVVEPSEDSQAKVGLFEVLDRELPVAVSGTIGGMSGAFSLSIVGAANIALLEELRDYAGVVLLETAFGDVKYVRLTKVSWLRRGTAAAPRRFASITYAEVGNNLPESTT